jgi:G6PDH family F420-dependent oxidoreductase
MPEISYKLCGEEQSPQELIDSARRAEEAGFDFTMISDHYNPWIDRQGQSSFVWSVLGGLSQSTERITIGAAGACPTVRIHPAIRAQAAAKVAAMLSGRFVLGFGSGENLNEHILGDHRPEYAAPIRDDTFPRSMNSSRPATITSGYIRSGRIGKVSSDFSKKRSSRNSTVNEVWALISV